uniref:Aberrant root formation protein 4 n=1 Tax=Rhizophora mucronata TaxID=61149 RepID=A0A2P2LV83_RHIMU
MSVESTADLGEAASPNAMVLRLQDQLSSLSKSVENGDESSVSELVSFLDSASDAALLDPDNQDAQTNAFEAVSEIHRFLSSPSASQVVIDALSFELPKAVSKFAALSDRCLDAADCVVDSLISSSNPRDMLSILCEALDSSRRMINASGYVAPLLSGLSKGYIRIPWLLDCLRLNASLDVMMLLNTSIQELSDCS